MIYRQNIPTRQGMSLVEIIIYTVLLSFLMANMINYMYTIHLRNTMLADEINSDQNK